ncbi:MAG: cobalamin-dependent protein [Nitrospiraceae bacterium]|nr:MAG: cobalamin-dependent protein [Nitrospiraceae bacterium]
MKISLLNSQVLDGNNVVPPLGLLYVAAVLERAGHDLQVIDADPDYDNTIVNNVLEFDPDLIGMAFLTPGYQKALRLRKKLKQALPDKTYCAGGFHTTVKPVETLNELDLDFVVVGEGEETIVEACERLSNGEDLEGVKGVMYNRDGEVVDNGRRELIEDLDSLPFPARHLIDMSPYLKPPGIIRGHADGHQTTIVTSRGCAYRCIYCGSHNMFGRRSRLRSARNVVDEMEHLKKTFGMKGIYFCDDSFTLSPKRVHEFCDELMERKLDMQWACHSRVDQTGRDFMKKMKDAGLVQLDYGVESGSSKILKVLGKGGAGDRKEQIIKSFQLSKELKIRTLATFIVGNPEETDADLQESFDLAKELKADYTAFYFLTPYPGSDIYKTAIEKGWLDKDLPFSEIWSHRQPEMPLISITFEKEKLSRIRRRMQNHFFIRNYFSNIRNFGFYFTLLFNMLKSPKIIVVALVKLFKTRRLDYVAEALNAHYWLMKKYEKTT